LPAARYGITSGAKNMIATVILAAARLSSSKRFNRQREDVVNAALGLEQASTLSAAAAEILG
jgi:hypothetical protein